ADLVQHHDAADKRRASVLLHEKWGSRRLRLIVRTVGPDHQRTRLANSNRSSWLKSTIENLKSYIQAELQMAGIRDRLHRFIQDRSSKAGTRHEEVFTREFLCPVIGKFFYEHVRSELNLSDAEIKRGLGTEGFENCPGFGF